MRRSFITGLLIVVPLVVTYLVLKFVFESIDGILAPVVYAIFNRHIPGVGLLATILLVFVAGAIGTGVMGQRLVRMWERWLTRLPLIRVVYGAAKQLIEGFAMPERPGFKQVALVEYPRVGIYTLCFLANRVPIKKKGDRRLYASVFVPTTPAPFTGFVILVPVEDVVILDLPVEDAVKLIVSGGIVVPTELPEAVGG